MDCSFINGHKKFNFRVGAVITDGKRLLMTADSHSPWYWVPGGVEEQKARLEAEGHTIITKGRTNIRYFVKDYEKSLFELK